MNSIEYCTDNGFFVQGRFCNFSDEVEDSFLHGRSKDICHIISFKCMALGLTNAFRYYDFCKRNPLYNMLDTINDSLSYVLGMIISVKRIMISLDKVNERGFLKIEKVFESEESISQYKQYFELLYFNMNDVVDISDPNDYRYKSHMHLCSYYLNRILDLLYNELENLRSGDSKWNRSLKDAFDPNETSVNENDVTLLNKYDGIAIKNLVSFTLGKHRDIENTEDGLFLFLARNKENEAIVYSSINSRSDFQLISSFEVCLLPILYLDYYDDIYKKLEIW